MEKLTVTEKKLSRGIMQFVFPFALKKKKVEELADVLKGEGFTRFELDRLELENAFYGEENRCSHRNMEHYFLPFISKVLFPKRADDTGFHRYSKVYGCTAELKTSHISVPFTVLSADVIVCPFQLGLLTIRVEITKPDVTYSEALEFASRFRVLEDLALYDKKCEIHYENTPYEQVNHFLFRALLPEITGFFNHEVNKDSYFEKLPYFVDERIYVQGVFAFEDGAEIENTDLFRAGQLDGLNQDGKPALGAKNSSYIDDYCKNQTYRRWGPDTYYVSDQHSFCCLTNEQGERQQQLINQMYGEYYYSLLINLFYKIVLLKFSNEYTHVKLETEEEKMENLIKAINHFTSKFYFIELAPQAQGREIFSQLRRVFGTRALYEDVKDNLESLFQYQDKFSSNRNSYLLTILTLYTVIGGIYGMNQVIEDLKGNIDWDKMTHYSLFQYIALFVTFSGLVVGIALGVASIVKYFKERKRQREEV